EYVKLPSLLSCQPRRKFPLIIMLDGIEDPHNFGAILRTAAALNIDGEIISTVCEPGAQEYHKFNFDSPICLIFGNEHEGIRKSLIKKSDSSLYIPMSNNIGSLNVSVSCGIILAEVVSQWGKIEKIN